MPSNGFWRYDTRLMVVLGLTFGFVFFDRNSMSFLAPLVALDLHLNNTQIGMLSSALSLTWAISGFLVGALSDATGRRKPILLIAVVVFSLCSIGSGIATSFMLLLASRALMGLSEGGILPIAQSLIALESAEGRRGHNAGVMQNFGSSILGSFVAPLTLVAIATHYNWRIAFFVAAVPGLLCAVLVAKYVREPPAQSQSARPAATASPGASMRLLDMLKFRNMWLCILMSCFMVAWMVLGWTFLPVYYINAKQIAPSDMSIMMSVLGISAAVCSFIVPGLSDRLGRKPVMIIFCLIGMLTPLGALAYSGSLLTLGVLIFVGWSASGAFPIFMATIPSETIPARYVATSIGIVMGLGEISGGFLGPTIAGWAADRLGLQAPMLIMAGCALVASLFAMFLVETAPVKLRAANVASQIAA